MSSEDEGGFESGPGFEAGPGFEGGQEIEGEPEIEGRQGSGAEPTVQFDLYRARRADEQAQQETQTAYTFPPEYAADPGTVSPDLPRNAPPYPPAPASARLSGYAAPGYAAPGYASENAAPGYAAPPGRSGAPRWRSAAIFGGAVVLAAALGFGIWAAVGSSGSSAAGAAAGSSAGPTATGRAGKSGAHAKAQTFRVTIESVGADSFTGRLVADGKTVTIALTGKTRYGTKTHPFDRSGLTVGRTVIVHGRRTGADRVTATVVAANTEASSAAA